MRNIPIPISVFQFEILTSLDTGDKQPADFQNSSKTYFTSIPSD